MPVIQIPGDHFLMSTFVPAQPGHRICKLVGLHNKAERKSVKNVEGNVMVAEQRSRLGVMPHVH